MTKLWWKDIPDTAVTEKIYGALRTKHSPPRWAFIEELRGGTGYGGAREQRIDFVAIWLWGTGYRGGREKETISVVGYEIKASRADFSKELGNPNKRQALEEISTESFFAVPSGLVRPDEVPEGWGLIEVFQSGKTRCTKHAKQRSLDGWPWRQIQALARKYNKATGVDGSTDANIRQALWRLAGTEMTEDELLEVVREFYKTQLAYERDKVMKEHSTAVVERWKKGNYGYEQMVGLVEKVKELCGHHIRSDYGFSRWYEDNVTSDMPEQTKDDIRRAYYRLRDLVNRHKLLEEETR